MSTVKETCETKVRELAFLLRTLAWDYGIRQAKIVQTALVDALENIDLTKEPNDGAEPDEQGEDGDKG
jgi:hypothetical protein